MRRLLPLLLALALLGCKKEQAGGGESESKLAAAPTATTETPAPKGGGSGVEGTVTNPLQAMAQLAKAGEALNKGMGQQLGQVVNWRQLAPFVPDKLGEFVAEGDLDGSTGGMGTMQVSRVKRRYKAGDKTLRLEITDASLVPMLRAGFAMAAQIHEDSTKGIKKGVKMDGNPGMIDGLMDSLVLGKLPSKKSLKQSLTDLCRRAEDLDPILHSFKNDQQVRVGRGKHGQRHTVAFSAAEAAKALEGHIARQAEAGEQGFLDRDRAQFRLGESRDLCDPNGLLHHRVNSGQR